MKGIQREVKHRCGSPRKTQELRRRGRRVGHNRVARLMREGQLGARPRKPYRVTTESNHGHPVKENVLNRQFTVSAANRVWVSDITCIATAEGWMYLSAVLDLYSRRVVGWSMGKGLGTEVAMNAVGMALPDRRPTKGLVLHTDRGVQYCAKAFRALTGERGIVQSMSHKGDCWDNACAETFFASLKGELVGRRIFATREQARREIFEYMKCSTTAEGCTRTWGTARRLSLNAQRRETWRDEREEEDHQGFDEPGGPWARFQGESGVRTPPPPGAAAMRVA